MKTLAERSADIAGRACRSRATQFNPLVVLAVIDVIINVVKLYRTCQQFQPSPSEAAQRARPLFVNRLNRYARKSLQHYHLDATLHEPVADEILVEMAGMTDPEIFALADSAETQLL